MLLKRLLLFVTMCCTSLLSLCCDGLAAESPSVQRWAIVASHDSRDKALADLITARLTNLQHVQLVERESIRKVLNELKLSSSELVEPTKTVQFGKLVSADAFVLIEHETKSKPPLFRVRMIETRSGLRIADVLLKSDELEEEAERVEAALKLARNKLSTEDQARRCVGVVGIRNEEPGKMLTPVARTLSVLLEQDLQQNPALVVLEREQLHRLTEEHELTAIEQRLRASTALIEAGLRRSPDQNGYVITFKVISLNGKPTRSSQITTTTQELSEVRQAIRIAVESDLGKQDDLSAKPDPLAEAEVFATRRDWLRSVGRHGQAVMMAEAALALNPTEENHFQARRTYYFAAHHFNRLAKGLVDRRQVEQGHDTFRETLSAALRFYDLELAHIVSQIEQRGAGANVGQYTVFRPSIERPSAGEPPENERLRREVDQLAMEKYNLILHTKRQAGENIADLLIRRLDQTAGFAETPERFCDTVRALVPQIDEQIREGNRAQQLGDDYFRALFRQVRQSHDDYTGNSSFRRQWPRENLFPLFTWLTEHANPKIRLAGYYGLCLAQGDQGARAAKKALDTLFSFPADAPIQALEGVSMRVIGRLKDSGQDAEYFEKWLASAEKTRQPEHLIRWPTTIFWYISGKSSATTDWLSRYIALLDTGRFADDDAGRAGHLRRHIADRLARLGDRPLAPPATTTTEGPWADYVFTELKFEQPANFDQWIGIHLDEDRLQHGNKDALVIAWRQENGEACVGRARVEGGPIRQIGRSFPFQFGGELKLAASSGAIFVASSAPGFAMITNSKVQVFDQTDGAPADRVLAMAWLGDVLYVSFDSALAKFDPEKEKFTLLASAHAVQPRGSLDGGSRYYIRAMLSDKERGRLWLDIYSSDNSGRAGIWTFEPSTGKLDKILGLPSVYNRSAIRWSNGDIFFHSGRNWCTIDPRTRKVRVLNQFALFRPTYKGSIQMRRFLAIDEHIIGANGQIYDGEGGEYRRPMDFAWNVMVGLGDSALVANLATSVNKIWYIRPSAKKTAVTVDNIEEQNASKPQAGDRLENEQ